MVENETIVAQATAPGESAIAVVRMSGPQALEIASRRFRGTRSPRDSGSHRILFGAFLGAGDTPLDTVLVSVFRAPNSYTGEDVVEISSHGGAVIPGAILSALVEAGARPARPGEFTERAYRNGKLDLAQAEAVAALVKARSDRASRAAEAALGGSLSRRVSEMDGSLVPLLAEVEARIDFPNDVDEDWNSAVLADRCAAVATPLREWLTRLPAARRREQGVRVALVGRPNVGKSSLMNALLIRARHRERGARNHAGHRRGVDLARGSRGPSVRRRRRARAVRSSGAVGHRAGGRRRAPLRFGDPGPRSLRPTRDGRQRGGRPRGAGLDR